MRTLTVSRLFLYRNAKRQAVYVPFIRLQGKWLEQLGFPIGGKVHVTANQGEIILRPVEETPCG